MIEHSQSIVLMEQLQPSWLGSRLQRLAYVLSTRLAASVLVGATLIVALSFVITGDFISSDRSPIVAGGVALLTCVIAALVLTAIHVWQLETRRAPPKTSFWRSVIHMAGLGVVFGGVFGLHGVLIGLLQPNSIPSEAGPVPENFRTILTLLMALFPGFAFGLVGGGYIFIHRLLLEHFARSGHRG